MTETTGPEPTLETLDINIRWVSLTFARDLEAAADCCRMLHACDIPTAPAREDPALPDGDSPCEGIEILVPADHEMRASEVLASFALDDDPLELPAEIEEDVPAFTCAGFDEDDAFGFDGDDSVPLGSAFDCLSVFGDEDSEDLLDADTDTDTDTDTEANPDADADADAGDAFDDEEEDEFEDEDDAFDDDDDDDDEDDLADDLGLDDDDEDF